MSKPLHLAIARSPDLAEGDLGTEFLVSFAQELELEPTLATWNDPSVKWSRYDAVLLHSVGELQSYQSFADWLDLLDSLAIPAINPTSVLRWNVDRRHLLQLHQRGIGIVPTLVTSGRTLPNILSLIDGSDVVVTPTIRGSVLQCVRGTAGSGALRRAIRSLPIDVDYLVQSIGQEFEEAEAWSLLYVGSTLAYALRSRRGPDSRGENVLHQSTPGEVVRSAVRRLLETLNAIGLPHASYMRIDGICSQGQFLISDIDQVSSHPYFEQNDAARYLAREVARILNRPSTAAASDVVPVSLID